MYRKAEICEYTKRTSLLSRAHKGWSSIYVVLVAIAVVLVGSALLLARVDNLFDKDQALETETQKDGNPNRLLFPERSYTKNKVEKEEFDGKDRNDRERVGRLMRAARDAAICHSSRRSAMGRYNEKNWKRVEMLASREAITRKMYSSVFGLFQGAEQSGTEGRTEWKSAINDNAGHEPMKYSQIWNAAQRETNGNSLDEMEVRAVANETSRMHFRVENTNMDALEFENDSTGSVKYIANGENVFLLKHLQGAAYPKEDEDNVDDLPLLMIRNSFFNFHSQVLQPTNLQVVGERIILPSRPFMVGGGVKENDWPEDAHLGCAALADTASVDMQASCRQYNDGVEVSLCTSKPSYEVVLMLTQPHCTTFYHVFTELMTRFLAFYNLFQADERIKVAYADSSISDNFFDLLGVPDYRRIRLRRGEKWLYASTILVPPPMRQTRDTTKMYGPSPGTATGSLLRAVLVSDKRRSSRPYILVISRSKSQNGNESCEGARCVANEPAMLAALENEFSRKYDVVVFHHSDGIDKAIHMFGDHPRFIVGVHGAGWQNLAFCKNAKGRQGAPLYAIHMSDDHFRRDFYKPLAEQVDAQYIRYFLPGVEHYSENHVVDVNDLTRTIKELDYGDYDTSLASFNRRRAAYEKLKKR